MNVSYDSKSLHLWPNKPGSTQQPKIVKMIDIVKGHASVLTMAHSRKYRVSPPSHEFDYQISLVVMNDFKFVFLNELNNVIQPPIDASAVSLVNFAEFHDDKDLLVVGSILGVFTFRFEYQGKYSPQLATKVDPLARQVRLRLLDRTKVEETFEFVKGLRIDPQANAIISWSWAMGEE